MNNEKRIEFYKRRSVGDVLSAGADFIRQNWKVLFRNVFIVGGPLACLYGYFMHEYKLTAPNAFVTPIDNGSFIYNALFFIVIAVVLSLFLYAMTLAVMTHYGEGKLTQQTGWSDLKGNVFAYAKKIFVVGLILFGVIILVAIAVGVIFGGLSGISPDSALGFSFLLLVLLVIFAPGLCLIVYPAVFHQQSAASSISTAFSLSFRYWGSTFLVMLVSSIVMFLFSVLVSGLYDIWIAFGSTILPMRIVFDIVCYILAIVSAFATLIATPVLVAFLAFQYFNIVEREEGVSVQSDVDEFDNL